MKRIEIDGISKDEFTELLTGIVRAELQAHTSRSGTESEKLQSVKQLAAEINVSELTVRNWIAEGKITAKKMGRRIFIESSQFANGLEDVKSLKYKR